MPAIVSVQDLRKAYAGGLEALKGVSLDIEDAGTRSGTGRHDD